MAVMSSLLLQTAGLLGSLFAVASPVAPHNDLAPFYRRAGVATTSQLSALSTMSPAILPGGLPLPESHAWPVRAHQRRQQYSTKPDTPDDEAQHNNRQECDMEWPLDENGEQEDVDEVIEAMDIMCFDGEKGIWDVSFLHVSARAGI